MARVLPIARVLAGQGAAVRLVIPPWDDPSSAGQVLQEDNLEIVHATLATGPLHRPALLRRIVNLVREFRPDVLHVFKPIGYSGLVGWWAARGGLGDILSVVDADDCEGRAGWSGRRGLRIEGRLRDWQEQSTLRSVGRVSVASEWLRAYAREIGIDESKIFWLPNGHAREGVTPLAGDGGTTPVLLWYTRFTEALPERAAALLAPLVAADGSLRLVVLGDELTRDARGRAREAFARLGTAAQIEWLSYTPQALEQLLETRGVVAVYPLDDDVANRARSPSKLIDLMALGVPLVAEAVGEAKRYLAGFEVECLAPVGDPDGFQKRVSRLLCEPALRSTLAGRLRAAATGWRWEGVAGGLLDWYEELLHQ